MTTSNEMIARISEGDVDRVKEIIKRAPFLIHIRDGAGRTPLSVAAWCGHTGIAKLLLDSGAEVNARDQYGWTPLREAEVSDRRPVIDLLRQCGARH